jgi:hypothetical protein
MLAADMRAALTLAVFVLLTSATHGEAQELAGTFDQLRVLVQAGDRVRVVDTSGRDIRGTIAGIGPSSLTLETEGTRRDFAESEVTAIHQRRPDSLANGALWGFGVGAGLGLYGGLALSGADGSSAGIIPVITLAYAGIGAGVGAGLDALLSAERVIFAGRTTASVSVSPIVSYRKRTIGLSVLLTR